MSTPRSIRLAIEACRPCKVRRHLLVFLLSIDRVVDVLASATNLNSYANILIYCVHSGRLSFFGIDHTGISFTNNS
jgi:hypothetical protein